MSSISIKKKSYNIYDLKDVPQIIAEGNINDTDLEGKTITFTVCRIGCLETLKYLVKSGADVFIKDNYGSTCLAVACGVGHINQVKYLVDELHMDINECGSKNQSLVMVACRCGRLEVVKFLTEKGANLSSLDVSGYTCLIWSVTRNNLHVTKYLLEQKLQHIDINDYENTGMDALMFACKLSNFPAVKMLVEAGISLSNCNSKGKNCLYFSMSRGNKNKEITDYLLQHGAVSNKKLVHTYDDFLLDNILNTQ